MSEHKITVKSRYNGETEAAIQEAKDIIEGKIQPKRYVSFDDVSKDLTDAEECNQNLRTWAEIRPQIMSDEEIAESDLRVALIGKSLQIRWERIIWMLFLLNSANMVGKLNMMKVVYHAKNPFVTMLTLTKV